MLLDFEIEWWIGYLIGLGAIALFSKERLNRNPKDQEAVTERERLILLLLPGQLAGRSVFTRGIVSYFLMLTAIYSVFAVFGSYLVPLFGNAMNTSFDLKPTDPVWPVGMALVTIGLLPEISIISRIERKARDAAYWLIGVPDNFNDFTDRLMNVKMDAQDIPQDLLDPSEANKLSELLNSAKSAFGSGIDYQALEQNMIKLWCFREWVKNPSHWPSHNVRREYSTIEKNILPTVLGVVEDLEALPTVANLQEDPGQTTYRSRWKSVAERANRATDQACALFALFAERSDTRPTKYNPISELLRSLIDLANVGKVQKVKMVDNLLLILLAMAVVSYTLGHIGNQGEFSESLGFMVRSLLVFVPVAVITFGVRFRRKSKWVNYLQSGGSKGGKAHFPTTQYAGHAMRVGLLVLIVTAGYSFYFQLGQHMASHGENGQAACVMWQFTGFSTEGIRATCSGILKPGTYDQLTEPGYVAGIWFQMHYGVIGSIVAVALALIADCLSADRPRWLRVGIITIFAGGLATIVVNIAGNALGITEYASEIVKFESLSTGLLSVFLLTFVALLISPRSAGVTKGATKVPAT